MRMRAKKKKKVEMQDMRDRWLPPIHGQKDK